MADLSLLSLLILVPLIGAAVALFIPSDQQRVSKAWIVIVAFITAAIALSVAARFDPAQPGLQLEESVAWIPSLGINFHLGVDGIGMAMVLLTGLVFIVVGFASYSPQIGFRAKEYSVMILVVEAAAMGVFVALDYILFFIFWELTLIPTYFLVAIWGGPRREYAAIKFLIYTMVGSLVMLVGILALYFKTGGATFSIPELVRLAPSVPESWRFWIFLAFFLGFAVKVPLWPFHTWLPDAHGEAPTPVHVILAAVLLKMGAFGFFRIALPTFPDVARDLAPVIATLGVLNIVYGAFATMAQTDFKRFVAYSSVSHMGYVMLGVAAATPAALNGAVFQMISHGLIGPTLFLMVGVWYDRTHTLEISRLSGMNIATPRAATILTFAGMANLGLPGLSGFVAEFFTVVGAIDVFRQLVYVVLIGIVITAAFNLVMLHRVVMGKPRPEYAVMPDIMPREWATLLPLMAFTLILGVWPTLVTNITNGSVLELVARLGGS